MLTNRISSAYEVIKFRVQNWCIYRLFLKLSLEIINKLPTNAMIQAAVSSKKLDNSTSLPDMRKLLTEYSITQGNLDFLRAIHVAGSKGKGSVCAFTEQILRCKGFRTGMFTSPHLVHPRERIRIDGKPVSEDIFAKHVIRLDTLMRERGDQISFFRFIWIIALDIFREAGVDVGIIEVGIGGRYDATNVLENPIVCGITSLAMEHVNLLGPTIREIAWNKAGIIKQSVPVFSVPQIVHPETEQVLQNEALEKGTSLEIIKTLNWIEDSWKLGIEGPHQRDNAALACALADCWIKNCNLSTVLSKAEIKFALQSTHWPGRQHRHDLNDSVSLFLDGSHTFESITATADWFSKVDNGRRNILFFHCSSDRDYKKLLEPLINIKFSYVFFMIPESAQGDHAAITEKHVEMAKYWESRTGSSATVISTVPESIYEHPTNALVCGSLYLVGHFMKFYAIDT